MPSNGVGVDVSEHMSVLTPSVDLGPLPDGAGLYLSNGVALNTVLSPWTDLGLPTHIYQSFQADNDAPWYGAATRTGPSCDAKDAGSYASGRNL